MKNTIILLLVLTIFSCSSDDSGNKNIESSDWSVNEQEVTGSFHLFPLSLDPEFVSVSNTSLNDNDLVGIVSFGSEIRVFPYDYLYQHEVVNARNNNFNYAFSYCPITKSAIAFKRDQTFRASGYLYKDNLTPWDESSGTIWSQMLGVGINGTRQNEVLQKIPILETSWKTVKNFYSNVKVLKQNSSSKLFRDSQEPDDDNDDIVELPFAGERTYGIVENNLNDVHFFRYGDFQEYKRKDVVIKGQKYIVYGNESKRVINAFKVSDFDDFQLLEDSEFPKILISNNIKYDVLGNSNNGTVLEKADFAYVAAWFAWDDFFGKYHFYPNP